ncbi:MAG: DEAD/DEAH box helicase family protein, partial [Burkholderiaceae bacterium]|nr:DEAD/DEAH box helicase family protein [Burkholderiaceae bacterium]
MKNAKLGFRNWGVSQTLSLLRDTGDYYRLPRGCLGQVGQLVEIEIENQTIENPVDFPPSSLSLRPYQQTAVNALLQSNQGLLVAPCGAGKTEIGCDLIHIRCQKTLIITHMKDLVQQWAERISSKLNIEAGIIGAGRWDDSKAVTVATVQSLRNCLQPSFVNQFGMVVLDECHHAPAKTFCEILNLFPARCRYGLSATPTRADGLEFLMYAAFGRILHEITDADMGADH